MASHTKGLVFAVVGMFAVVGLFAASLKGSYVQKGEEADERRLQAFGATTAAPFPAAVPVAFATAAPMPGTVDEYGCEVGDAWCEFMAEHNIDFAKEMHPENNWYHYVIDVVITAIFAFLYKTRIVDKLPPLAPKPPAEGMHIWSQFGIFACCSDIHTCCYVCCCPFSVAAKNYDRAGVMEFWPACAILYITYQCCCVGALIRTYLTSQFKDHLGIPHGMFSDCCLSCWCFPCETGRESMLVDEELGMDIKCILKVEPAHHALVQH